MHRPLGEYILNVGCGIENGWTQGTERKKLLKELAQIRANGGTGCGSMAGHGVRLTK